MMKDDDEVDEWWWWMNGEEGIRCMLIVKVVDECVDVSCRWMLMMTTLDDEWYGELPAGGYQGIKIHSFNKYYSLLVELLLS